VKPHARDPNKPIDCGPCATCQEQSTGGIACKYCDKIYAYCDAHPEKSKWLVGGHVLRLHPDRIPHDKFLALLCDADAMADIDKRSMKDPVSWQRFSQYVRAFKRSQL
jgi:hypothetical protein